ncbi:UrcA family protein [Citromicrobium bathyomarinum]
MNAHTLALAVALTIGGSPALADPGENRVAVRYDDLDLRSTAGRTILDRRLDDAIRKVCRSPHSRSVRVASETKACIAQLQEKVAQLRNRIIAEAADAPPGDKRD